MASALPWFAGVGIAVLLLGYNYRQRASLPIVDIDEAAKIYSSYYYHLAFEKRDLTSPDWRHLDAVDHPPVGKYLLGATLAAHGYRVTSITLKENWIKDSAVLVALVITRRFTMERFVAEHPEWEQQAAQHAREWQRRVDEYHAQDIDWRRH